MRVLHYFTCFTCFPYLTLPMYPIMIMVFELNACGPKNTEAGNGDRRSGIGLEVPSCITCFTLLHLLGLLYFTTLSVLNRVSRQVGAIEKTKTMVGDRRPGEWI